VRFPFPPEEGADDLNPNRQRRCHGRGHRPCHSATLTPGQPGAQSPRPAPAPPPAGASRPPGRALASVGAGGDGPGGSVPRGRGKRMRFPFPPGDGGSTDSEPPAPLPWQGPSPLPQRPADPWPAGGPKPPASARPAPGGRFSPAGPGAGLCRCGLQGYWWQRSARAGKRMRFLFPPGLGAEDQSPNRQPRCHGRGHRPCHSATLTPGQRPPRPRRALLARRAGRWPAVRLDLPVCGEPFRTGGETRCVSGSRPKGQSRSPDREESPGRQAVGLPFQRPVTRGVARREAMAGAMTPQESAALLSAEVPQVARERVPDRLDDSALHRRLAASARHLWYRDHRASRLPVARSIWRFGRGSVRLCWP
jgi:hypothetical protein